MEYLKIFWVSKEAENTALYFYEIDDSRFEVRKVEIRQDGSTGHASQEVEVNGTFCGDAKMPEVAEIAKETDIYPFVIEKGEFEHVWSRMNER